MPQEESQEIKELRSEMRKGRTPLIDAIRSAYKPYLIAMKGWERKNAELREQVAPIVPTGAKTYPATYAHGSLTFSNGSVIGQSIPQGFTIDDAATDAPTYVSPATANGFGMSTVSAHLLTSGINMSTLAINEAVGSSLFIRNLSPFTGGRPAHSVKFVTAQDKQVATDIARSSVISQKAHIIGYQAKPCVETLTTIGSKIVFSLSCQFANYKVPSFMRVQSAKLVGTKFLVDVVFVARPRPVWFR